MVAMSAVVPGSEEATGPVAVLAAVYVVAVLVAVSVAAVHGSAPAEGHSRTSPAASDGCPLGKRLGTVAEAVDVLGRCRWRCLRRCLSLWCLRWCLWRQCWRRCMGQHLLRDKAGRLLQPRTAAHWGRVWGLLLRL
ncbi:hypothetical protein NDU88_003612 [Pleurodeles waltl]|uniref:Uncharacterized protein n=1 Tax=Pleurodeles waltl TaxID=8319 RepID=A0AAV7T5G0_PLEWA|nr:hypothetical protein NDU88_003612 [Pleurodeles waltl]